MIQIARDNDESLEEKVTSKSVKEKVNALNDLKKGMSNKEVAKKYGVAKNTLSTWVNNKEKYSELMKQGMQNCKGKQQNLRT